VPPCNVVIHIVKIR